jgi:hypothetical protein
MGLFDRLMRASGSAVSLEEAARSAPSSTGIYKLYLKGRLMKVGKAEWKAGIRWRMQQYWRGDSTAGIHGSQIYSHREHVTVSWRELPANQCREAERQAIENAGGIERLPWCERT